LLLSVPASTMATHIDYLHYFGITTTMVVSTLIGAAALGFYVKYRWKGRIGAKGEPVYTTFVGEALIIGVPAFFFLLWFAIGYRDFVRIQTPPADAMDVYVMGKQWMWKFAYPEGPNGLNVLRVPSHRPVRLLMTSRDVIHSFFIPAFRMKMDVLPGRYLAESAGCFKCHSTDGSPHIGPTWLDMYLRKETLQGGAVQIADEAYITESMMDPKAKQVLGFQLVMPGYRERLEGPESAA